MDHPTRTPPPDEPSNASETTTAAPIRHLEFKVAMLLALTLVFSAAFAAYVLYARGVFDSKQSVVLVTDDSEGVNVGMPLTFAGFVIGRVRRIELGDDAKVRIHIDVPTAEARWLRVSSVFLIEKSLVGGIRIRAVTGQLEDPPLPAGAVRNVLRGDTTEELPRLVSSLKAILENLQKMTGADSSLNASIGNVQTVTERMAGRSGMLAAALGGEENAKRIFATLERTNALLDSMGRVSSNLDRTLAKADQRMFGGGGVMDETQKAVVQLNAILGDARESLKKADAVLVDTQKISANARGATDDLAGLRAEVDASLRKVGALIDEVNRKWPFKRDTELRLP
jgi:phospholipid/cholesterol/gamma-HCH transport system substrate-binding protein